MQNKNSNSHLIRKYLGLTMQWIALLVVAFLVGRWADSAIGFTLPVITLVLLIASIAGLLYQVIRDTGKQ